VASLLSTGRAIKGSALAGLTSVAQQEASRNIAEEQLKQAKEAQTQQLIGTGLGVSGAYLAPKAIAAMKDSAEVAKLFADGDLFAGAGQAASSVGAIPAEVAAGAATTAETAAATTAAAEGTAAAGASGGATALLTNPYTYAAIAAAFLLKKIFD